MFSKCVKTHINRWGRILFSHCSFSFLLLQTILVLTWMLEEPTRIWTSPKRQKRLTWLPNPSCRRYLIICFFLFFVFFCFHLCNCYSFQAVRFLVATVYHLMVADHAAYKSLSVIPWKTLIKYNECGHGVDELNYLITVLG